jgi:hypothetical protein
LAKLFWLILHSRNDLFKHSIVYDALSKFFSLARSYSFKWVFSAFRVTLSSLAFTKSSFNFFICASCKEFKDLNFSFSADYCCTFFSRDFMRPSIRRDESALCYRVCYILYRDELRLLLRKGTALGGKVSLPRLESCWVNLVGLVGHLGCYCLL